MGDLRVPALHPVDRVEEVLRDAEALHVLPHVGDVAAEQIELLPLVAGLVQEGHELGVDLVLQHQRVVVIHIDPGVAQVGLEAADEGPVDQQLVVVEQQAHVIAPEVVQRQHREIGPQVPGGAHGPGDAGRRLHQAVIPLGVALDLEKPGPVEAQTAVQILRDAPDALVGREDPGAHGDTGPDALAAAGADQAQHAVPVGKAVHGVLRPRQILAQDVALPVGEGLLQRGAAADAARPLGSLSDGGPDEDGVGGHVLHPGIEGGQIVRPGQEGVGSGLVPADAHGLRRRGDQSRVEPVPGLAQGQHRAVVGGIDVVHPVFVDDAVHVVHQRGIVRVGGAFHAGLKDQVRVAGHAGGADEADEFGAAQRRVDLKGDLRSRREHKHRFSFSHFRSPYVSHARNAICACSLMRIAAGQSPFGSAGSAGSFLSPSGESAGIAAVKPAF